MTNYHSKYWAYALNLKSASNSIQNLSRSIANARLDLNPHQVRAALFALQSPISKGVILADEVGLGKTIEAGLIIAQKWAEKKRSILLIVPAFLRKQWEAELREKFYLPSRILDSKTVGSHNPFESSTEILICSYQFAAQRSKDLKKKWDLVVIDEAHRMRNVYKTSNKQARAISEALIEIPKVLLTATPLQNNLMELYGLINVIDPHVFGDEATFRDQFALSRNEENRNQLLKKRLEPFIIRTLRKQVQEYIPFTKRIAITHNFTANDDEQELYEAVSAYLQRKDLAALPNGQRQLITLVLRKLLASSSFAITQTLERMVKRLEKEAGPKHLLEEMDVDLLESLDEELKESLISTLPDVEMREEKEKIRQEALELSSYVELAMKINRNSKGEALIIALDEGLAKASELGALRKAVIFTESTRTQAYLHTLLTERGYAGKIVRINGSNADPESKATYDSWIQNQGDSFKNSSKAVDMKAALVQKFRDDGVIFLATEAAAEGLNLQFSSIVVNYDLPWNPQKIEQRIGRCHRYGQKHDVVVVNFVNTRNEADKRVFELLNEKFKLFDGVFGASDEVLGAIESGVDIEMRIHGVYQTCRTSEEIQKAFDQLQQDLDEQIQTSYQQTRKNLLDHFDEEVTSLLKLHQTEIKNSLSQRERWLSSLVAKELGIPQNESHITLPNTSEAAYFKWELARDHNAPLLREDDPIPQELIKKALQRNLEVSELHFNYSAHDKKISLLESLVGTSGWLELTLFEVESFEMEQFLLFAGITDEGIPVDPDACEKLFHLSAQDQSVGLIPPCLEALFEPQKAILSKTIEERAETIYETEVDKLEAWSEDLKLALESELKTLDKEIKDTRKQYALAKKLPDKLQIQKQIQSLEKQRSQKRRSLFDEEDRIDQERESIISNHTRSLEPKQTSRSVFRIRFKIT